ncbi:hypothetical protein EYF80_027006 [Liparis tanakae]|uniref:Uncharacterized protein n=1 Tax=Liparis tanakae TaxID=230148 RepID=A0A4Z2HB85_9TELE|nr:hypothetical protein EYF80_027006 [Liparis tanakae]
MDPPGMLRIDGPVDNIEEEEGEGEEGPCVEVDAFGRSRVAELPPYRLAAQPQRHCFPSGPLGLSDHQPSQILPVQPE